MRAELKPVPQVIFGESGVIIVFFIFSIVVFVMFPTLFLHVLNCFFVILEIGFVVVSIVCCV